MILLNLKFELPKFKLKTEVFKAKTLKNIEFLMIILLS